MLQSDAPVGYFSNTKNALLAVAASIPNSGALLEKYNLFSPQKSLQLEDELSLYTHQLTTQI
jgi:hypothetical protein